MLNSNFVLHDSERLESVTFDGDQLQAVKDGEHVWVVVKRVCESLGIAEQRQAQKLKGKPWAVTTFLVATGPDGKSYEMLCLEHRKLPMWLATINSSRVAEHLRSKLERYQCAAADVLADHFLGPVEPQFAWKVESFDQLMNAEGLLLLEDIAPPLSITRSDLFECLRSPAVGWIYRPKRKENQPTAKASVDNKWLTIRYSVVNGVKRKQLYITKEGLEKLLHVWAAWDRQQKQIVFRELTAGMKPIFPGNLRKNGFGK